MSRKKLIITAVILTLILIIGGVLAYFTDVDTKTNRFTLGNVEILVEEPSWQGTGGDNGGDAGVVENIVPNQSIPKDPQITNKGTADIYAFVKVAVPYRNVIVGDATAAADTELFTYTLNQGWTEVGNAETNTDDKTVTHVYAYTGSNASTLEALAKDGKTTPVFDCVVFADVKETGDLAESESIQGKEFAVEVSGYGIQTTDSETAAPADVWALINGGN